MAHRNKNVPDWFDPLGIRGSILDPLATFNEAAKLVAPVTQPFTWMMTTAARRLQGRQVRIKSTPAIEARVASIDEVAPATELPLTALIGNLALWRRAVFSVDRVVVGGKPIDRVDVVATDIRVRDSSARQVLISEVKLVATLTAESLAVWMRELGADGEFDFGSGNIRVRPVARVPWLTVVAEPTLRSRGVEARVLALRIGPLRFPVPKRLSTTRSVHFPHLPEGLELTDMRATDGRRLEVTVKGSGIDFPIDMPRLMAEIGVEGTMSVVNILRP